MLRPYVIEEWHGDHFTARIFWADGIEGEPESHSVHTAILDVVNDVLVVNASDLGSNTVEDMKATWRVWIDLANAQWADHTLAIPPEIERDDETEDDA